MMANGRIRPLWPVLVSILLALFVAGCSSSPQDAGLSLVDPSGNHPANFLSTHPGFAVSNVSQCTSCHGNDLMGGISKQSCFLSSCHHDPVPGWASPAEHGASAKRAPGNSGFKSCQICHGADFSGDGSGVACSDCHVVDAPHPAAPWHAPGGSNHATTDPANAPVCAACHFSGSPNNPAGHPATPAPAGTPPGCFNSTLCHGASAVPHPVGGAWVTGSPPQPHGNDAKAAPGSSTGLLYCQACHGTGTDFAGGSSGISCYTCHGASAPHPDLWRSGNNIYVHTSVDGGNASVCAFCHTDGANSPIAPPSPPAPAGTPPGCFNSTLCHGAAAAPHALGSAWILPGASFHGLTAKADLAACQACHGTPGTILFDGGVAPTACSLCHNAADAHPTTWSQAPQTGFPPYTASHRNAGSFATACAICHVVDGPGTGPNPAAPSCFSASFTNGDGVTASCHASGPSASHLVPFLDPNHLGVDQVEFAGDCALCHAVSGTSPIPSAPACQVCHTAGSPLAPPPGSFGVCTSCHGYPPDGTPGTYPNIAGAHAVHLDLDLLGPGTPVDCDTCHLGLGFVTQAHYDLANGRPGAGGRIPPGDLAFDNTYNAQSGAPSFDNTLSVLSCSNVSCHGGQTTPNWQTGTIDVDTAAGCLQCHAYAAGQYNSYSSGEHDRSQHVAAGCTACHNTTSLAASHFNALSTTAMEGPASATVGGTGTSVTSYVAPTCIAVCHPGGETW